MKKNKAIILLLVFVLLLAGLGYTATVGLGVDGSGSAGSINLGLDLEGGVSITYQVVGDEKPSSEDMSDTIYKLQQRVDGYSTESVVYQEGDDRINIEIPGVSDANAILEELGKPGSLYFIRQTDSDGNLNYQYTGTDEEGQPVYTLTKSIEELQADGSIVLTGTDVKNAERRSYQNQMKNYEFVVSLTMTPEGVQKFADATTNAYQNSESIAIYYDGKIISAPNVNEPILGGEAQITGNFTSDEAEQLASTIRIGGLKLELEELHSKIVGAQLGEEAISTSIKAAIIGFVVIVLFMILVYRIAGLAASLALGLYVELIVILLDAFDITLTLPGIAGIILSIGMAVDANVIIFARIREEIAKGKTVRSAIDTGFKKATSAIVDGNITTLIAAAVLAIMGTGTIKGFAITLAIGIVLSVFTALVVSQSVLNAVVTLGMNNPKFFGKERKPGKVDFIKGGKYCVIASVLIIVVGFCFMPVFSKTKGSALNLSIDFAGGTSITAEFDKEYSLAEAEKEIVPVIAEAAGISEADISVQTVSGTNEIMFKTSELTSQGEDSQVTAVTDALNDKFGATVTQSDNISGSASGEMAKNAIFSVILAAILMLIYIVIRFKDVRFGASAVLALCHDVAMVFVLYILLRLSVGNTCIACMLTIFGYSINSTIVIFDRIRENISLAGTKKDYREIVNRSVNQTITRNIFTSLTTFVTIFVLYLLGVAAIKEFAFTLMAGVVIGAYSSICITGPMWYFFKTKIGKKKDAVRK